jgi:hypothetical protein
MVYFYTKNGYLIYLKGVGIENQMPLVLVFPFWYILITLKTFRRHFFQLINNNQKNNLFQITKRNLASALRINLATHIGGKKAGAQHKILLPAMKEVTAEKNLENKFDVGLEHKNRKERCFQTFLEMRSANILQGETSIKSPESYCFVFINGTFI